MHGGRTNRGIVPIIRLFQKERISFRWAAKPSFQIPSLLAARAETGEAISTMWKAGFGRDGWMMKSGRASRRTRKFLNRYRLLFFLMGVFHVLMGGLIFIAALWTNSKPHYVIWIILALAAMCFSISYLYPQWAAKNERMKFIRQKGTFFTMAAFLLYLMVFFLLYSLGVMALSAPELISILTALFISTLWLSFVVYSKIG